MRAAAADKIQIPLKRSIRDRHDNPVADGQQESPSVQDYHGDGLPGRRQDHEHQPRLAEVGERGLSRYLAELEPTQAQT